jgi:hypothetical protein
MQSEKTEVTLQVSQLFIQIDEALARRIESFSLIVLFCSDLFAVVWFVCSVVEFVVGWLHERVRVQRC